MIKLKVKTLIKTKGIIMKHIIKGALMYEIIVKKKKKKKKNFVDIWRR